MDILGLGNCQSYQVSHFYGGETFWLRKSIWGEQCHIYLIMLCIWREQCNISYHALYLYFVYHVFYHILYLYSILWIFLNYPSRHSSISSCLLSSPTVSPWPSTHPFQRATPITSTRCWYVHIFIFIHLQVIMYLLRNCYAFLLVYSYINMFLCIVF